VPSADLPKRLELCCMVLAEEGGVVWICCLSSGACGCV